MYGKLQGLVFKVGSFFCFNHFAIRGRNLTVKCTIDPNVAVQAQVSNKKITYRVIPEQVPVGP